MARVFYFVTLLWIIHSSRALFHLPLEFLTVFPRDPVGLLGVLFAPMLHSDWDHLMANTVPLLGLGALVAYAYPKTQLRLWLLVWLGSGLGVWLFGRSAHHLGASGIVTGLFYFLLLAAIIRRDKKSIAVMFTAVILAGSVFLGVLPFDPKISFESHLFGALSGVAGAIIWRYLDPVPEPKRYDWEFEADSDDDTWWQHPPPPLTHFSDGDATTNEGRDSLGSNQ